MGGSYLRLKQEGDASSDEEEQLIAEASFQSDEPLAIDDSRLSDQDDSLIIKTSADSDEPTRSTLSLVVLNLAWIGLASNLVAWGIVMLPSQVRSSVGDEQDGIALAMIVLVGSLVTLVATPYIGLWSDRCTSRFGRRRPFMAIGLVVVVLAQLLLGAVNPDKPIEDTEDALCNITSTNSSSSNSSNSSSTVGQLASGEATTENKSFASSPQIWMLLVIYCFATLGYQLIGTPYNGLLADKTPTNQRGVSSGVMGFFSVVGNLLGASAGLAYSSLSIVFIYVLLGSLLAATVLPILFTQKEQRHVPKDKLPKATFSFVLQQFVEPLRDHDFRWVFLTRFLMQQGMATVMFFLEFYFHDIIPLPDGMRAEEAVSLALVPLFITSAVSSIIAGKVSDMVGGKRRIFVFTSAIVMAASAVIMSFVNSLTMCLVLAVIFGLGFGCFVAVDFAMVLDVLPDAEERAKDLAVWHQALVLPQLIATPIAGTVRDLIQRYACDSPSHGGGCREPSHCRVAYIALFATSAFYFLLSAAFVKRIRNVR